MDINTKLTMWSLGISLVNATITIGLNLFWNIKRESNDQEWKKKIEDKEVENEAKLDRIQCASDFKEVISKKELMTDVFSELDDLTDLTIEQTRKPEYVKLYSANKKIIRRCYNRCLSFYNELDDFCSKIVDDTYNCDDFIQKDVKQSVLDFALMQPEFYSAVKDCYKAYHVDSFVRFDMRRLRNIDKFIDKYLATQKNRIEQKRREFR